MHTFTSKRCGRNTYIIKKQSLDKMASQMLIVKIICEKTEDLWRADINVAILCIDKTKCSSDICVYSTYFIVNGNLPHTYYKNQIVLPKTD